MDFLNVVNASIAGAVIVIGIFLKNFLKDKKIKNFELKRLLPIILLIIAEVLNISYGLIKGENIIISISNGFISTFIATFGYDAAKSMIKGNKE